MTKEIKRDDKMNNFRENRVLVGKIKDLLNDQHSVMISLTEAGSQIYGWKTKESDVDLRGIHVVNTFELFRLGNIKEVIERRDMEYVSFEIKKAMNLLIKCNFNVVEDTLSPQMFTTPYYLELKKLVENSLTRQITDGYRGCAVSNYKKFLAAENTTYKDKAVKKYLYVYRTLMAGIYALEKEKIEPNIRELNKYFKFSTVDLLLSKKLDNDKEMLKADRDQADRELNGLFDWIDVAYIETDLPFRASEDVIEEYEDLLKRIRLEQMNG